MVWWMTKSEDTSGHYCLVMLITQKVKFLSYHHVRRVLARLPGRATRHVLVFSIAVCNEAATN